jgi:two-component system sensor histidine kinase DesK
MWVAHAAAIGFSGAQVVIGVPFYDPPNPAASVPTVVAVWALQLRHSRAAAEGRRLPGATWSWLLMAVLTLASVAVLGASWASLLWGFVASSLQLLPVRIAALSSAAVAAVMWPLTLVESGPVVSLAVDFVYFTIIMGGGGAALWASTRLVREIRRIEATRSAFAALDVRREQLRLAGDVHDLLGQTLTAIALRCDIGRRQLPVDPEAAVAQGRAVMDLALDALGDLRLAAYGERTVTLAAELDGSRAILAAAGITTTVDVDARAASCPDEIDAAMAWCVREAATNVARHAQATWCRFTVVGGADAVELDATNDGAGPGEVRAGNGLRGLTDRAGERGGRVSFGADDGVFRLHVVFPLPRADEA